MPKSLSLKARAIAALARREYSRNELRGKLQDHAESIEQLDPLLDSLEAAGLLSNERFAHSLSRRRADRFGVARIRHELQAHQLADELVGEQIAALQATELSRARAVWEKKFGETPPRDVHQRAKQIRFLATRGFAMDAIMRAVPNAKAGDDSD